MDVSLPSNGQNGMPSLYSTIDMSGGRGEKLIRFYHGDMTGTDQDYDIVCCSAFKGRYGPTPHSLIGALYDKKGISVQKLAENPCVDMRDQGGWISYPADKQFGRILCVELIDLREEYLGISSPFDVPPTVKASFLSLRSLLERADLQRIEIHRIALPILGAGYQGIGIEYIAPTLFAQCMYMFRTIQTLKTIDFYELELWKLKRLVSLCNDIFEVNLSMKPSVFISCASEQEEMGHTVWENIMERGIQAWIYTESIPVGGDFREEIPKAIAAIDVMVFILSPESQNKEWVLNEISSAIGARKTVLPFQISQFPLNKKIRFMLEGKQIYPLWKEDSNNMIPFIIREVEKHLEI